MADIFVTFLFALLGYALGFRRATIMFERWIKDLPAPGGPT